MFQRKFDNIHCFELTQVMCQIDDQFVEVLNRFWTIIHNSIDITLLNHTYLCLPPNDLNFPYIYYTNKSTKERNDFIFQNIKGQGYVFDADNQHHDTCLKHFKLKNDSSQIIGLHSKIQIKIGMLIELCARNYATHDELFNGVDGVFQYFTRLQKNESFIWIGFNNPKAGSGTRI